MPSSIRLATLGLALSFSLPAQSLLDVMREELDRNFTVLKEKADPPAYFAAYTITETESRSVSATMGTVQGTTRNQSRLLDVTVRVGTPKLDNYHKLPGENPHFTSASQVTLEDTEPAIRRALWLETDRTYRAGAQRLLKIRTDTKVNVAQQDGSDDFSSETPSKVTVEVPVLKWDAGTWEGVARRLSAGFSDYSGVLASSVGISVLREVKYFVNTEGTRLRHGRTFARVVIVARGKASDGMDLATSETFESLDTEGLPAEEYMLDAVQRAGKNLEGLLQAPVVDPYIGPAILSGRASGVFFHEIFGHRIEGHRQKDESEGQTFTKSLNEQILPPFLSVVFDPTKRRLGGVDLNGSYDYDDEGVKARRVPLVEHGILKTFLMSRSPVKGFPQSNGHGRKSPGLEVVSRQSNLLVESTKTVSNGKLRQMLIDEVKRQGKPYGLYFDSITGGFTTTSRRGLQAFKVIPLVVYRVYADGRPDELVRGADIVGTPLASFAKILATSDKAEVFNGYCGAESGSVPVAAVSPAILVSELEIQKTDQSQDRPPLLPRPVIEESAQ